VVENHRRVYDGSDRIAEIAVQGKKLTASVHKSLVSAALEYSNDKVTELSIEVQDDPSSSWWAQDLFAPEGTITFLDWRFQIGPVKDGPGKAGPVVTLKAPSKYVEAIRKSENPGPGQVEVSTFASEVIRKAGAIPLVQPGLGDRTIEAVETESDTTPSGKPRKQPNDWDHLSKLREQVGAWLFEYGSSIVLAKPTYIKDQNWITRWEVRWDSLDSHSPELLEKPTYEHDPSKEPHEAESLRLKLYASDIDQVRTGDLVTLTGKGVGRAAGEWLVAKGRLPMTSPADVLELTLARPIDPPEIIPESTSGGSGEATAGVPAGPIGSGGWKGEQLENASKIVREGQSRSLPTLAIQLAVACAMGESTLTIVPYGDAAGPDSRGLFQQRDSWGSLQDRMNAEKSAGFFYEALTKTPYQEHYNAGGNALPASNIGAAYVGPGGSANSASLAIHHAQINADPYHYAKYWSDAKAVVQACLDAAKGSAEDAKGSGVPKAIGDKANAFIGKYNGKAIDVDGAWGAQCVDSVQQYATEYFGAPYIIGNGKDWWKHPDLLAKFTPIGPGSKARLGDIAVWGVNAFGGKYGAYGHVAGPVIEDRGGSLYTMSQNPDPNRKMNLEKTGLLGFMRPKS